MAEREGDPLLHHKVKGFDTQFNVFRELTCAQAVLSSTHTAADEIDRVIRTMLSEQRPGYIEVPRDMVTVEIDASWSTIDPSLPFLDPVALEEALADVMSELSRASTAVIHAGAMVERRHVESDLISFAMTAGIPVATSSLARGVFPERHPLGLGVYLGALSPENVVRRVEDADILLSLGVLQTDLTLGAFTANLDHKREVLCSDTDVTVGYRTYKGVPLWAFLPALNAALGGKTLNISHESIADHAPFVATGASLTVERTIDAISSHIDERHGVLLDPGEALFASVDMRVPTWSHGSGYYATMGYAVPGAVGAGLADPDRRPVVLVGDGAFAMTGLEVASCAFHGVPAVFIILDNQGYGTQRPILEGPFNEIHALAAEKLIDVIGMGQGWLVETEVELDAALSAALSCNEICIIRVRLPKTARSAALSRLGAALAARA
jgi:indolepyruvate decarboxylase